MKPRLKTSPAARELIKRFEPFRPQAVKGDDGRWVVGYGHRAAAKPGVRVNEDEAALLLIYDVMRAEEVVDDSITGPLSRGQRDALTSFVHDVGVDSFRGSEVARYLFEGRARAAGEALAAFGDGISSRREAESRLFLDALLPAQPGKARKSEPVELVIKIEHPSEERVLEGAIAGENASPAPAGADLPPPPPPFDAGLARRREAEDEIARILATVEALPPEVRRELGETEMAPVADAVSEMRDDPIEASYHAVDDAADVDDAHDAAPELVDEAAQDALSDAADDAEAEIKSAEETDPEAAADRVIARMAEDIADVGGEDGAVVAEEAPTENARESHGTASDTPATAPLAAFDLPESMGLGFVLTDNQPVQSSEPEQQAEPVDQAVAPAIAENSQAAKAVPEHYALDLPAGMGLGYALTSVMQGSFQIDPAEIAPEQTVAVDDGSGVAEPDETAEPDEIDDVTEMEVQPALDAEAEVVERAITVTGDDTPPPHPAETPAEAEGAVGDVEGEPVAGEDTGYVSADDDLGDDPMMADQDPMADAADDFTPRDLAADMHAAEPKPGPRSDDGMWTFLAVLIAGGLLAGIGSVLAASEWDYIMAQREMTLNFGMALAGFFLVIVAGWQLASIWLSKLKQKGSD
ncbi:hypothetical protein [Maricaulis sp.]|uniref:glycoside hydrolase family protein n=1 Tax=Maricaulis sp. TaxID=1486257 RepID=UPI0025C49E44|nr:hypothetical protein [Maricaulis sp.]